jgi:hypothetical protein
MIERVEFRSLDELRESFVGRSTPVIVSNSVDEETRAQYWSPATLRDLVGDRTVAVLRAEAGTFDYDAQGDRKYRSLQVPFADAMDALASAPEGSGPFHYVRQIRLEEVGLHPVGLLGAQLLPPEAGRVVPRLWVGAAGCVTPLHYDGKNNLLAQMHGRKRVTLLPPTEHANIYSYGVGHYAAHASRVDVEAVDAESFPDFPSAQMISFELLPGDTLFIPAFWWHHVRSLELSVSVNEWWPARPPQYLVPASVDYLRIHYQKEKLARTLTNEESPEPLRFAALAREASEKNLLCAATLFCGASVVALLDALASGTREEGAAQASEAGHASVAASLAERGIISEPEAKQAHFCLALADLAAAQGKTQKLPDVEKMVREISALVARYATAAVAGNQACAPHETI